MEIAIMFMANDRFFRMFLPLEEDSEPSNGVQSLTERLPGLANSAFVNSPSSSRLTLLAVPSLPLSQNYFADF
jgi:hypothetical protein